MYSAVLLLAMTTAPEPANCCWGCGWGWGWNYYVPTWAWAPTYYYYPAYYPAYYYQPAYWPAVTPVVAVAAKEKQPVLDGTETASRSRDEGGTQAATVVVTLPAGAKLTVDGQPLNDSASRRIFNTPPLKPGARYSYLMTAEIVRDGQSEQRTRKVVVRAGRQTLVNFDFDAVASGR